MFKLKLTGIATYTSPKIDRKILRRGVPGEDTFTTNDEQLASYLLNLTKDNIADTAEDTVAVPYFTLVASDEEIRPEPDGNDSTGGDDDGAGGGGSGADGDSTPPPPPPPPATRATQRTPAVKKPKA